MKYKMRLREKVKRFLNGKMSLQQIRRENAFEVLAEPLWRELDKCKKAHRNTKAIYRQLDNLRYIAGLQ